MFKLCKDIAITILISSFIVSIQDYFNTNFLITFLKDNLIVILIALLAINATTQSLVLTKVRELVDELPKESRNGVFSNTRKQMKNSIIEHIFLIALSISFFVLIESPKIREMEVFIKILQTGIISCFVYSLFNLYDNVNAVFILLDFNQE